MFNINPEIHTMSLKRFALIASLALAAHAHAQTMPTTGTLVIVPAMAEVSHQNDEANAIFTIEEQDKDKAAAANRVNQKMKQGTDTVRAQDPKASLKTMGYYTYPVYPEDRPLPSGQPDPRRKAPTSWRVGQNLEVKTTNIAGLPKMTAAVQKVLGLSGISFALTPETTRRMDDQRIAATYKNLNERIGSIAAAMGRKLADATLETVDFEGSGNYAGGAAANDAAYAPQNMRAMRAAAPEVSEPSFEPGETTLQMRLVGKVRFK